MTKLDIVDILEKVGWTKVLSLLVVLIVLVVWVIVYKPGPDELASLAEKLFMAVVGLATAVFIKRRFIG